jgi:signal transduction histidine kinase/HD-like signal output (HDOD) protein/ActR/RegA family two-component response regulator
MLYHHGKTKELNPQQRILNFIEDFPPLSPILLQALELSRQDDIDFKKLNSLVSSDPALTATFLKRVNRISNGLKGKVGSVEQSLTLLGLKSIRCVLLSLAVQDFLPNPASKLYNYQNLLWAHSLATGIAGQFIARCSYPELHNEAFIAGLLHDLGKLPLIRVYAEENFEDLQKPENLSSINEEQELLGTNHALLGKKIAQKLSLPENFKHVLWLHHQPAGSIDSQQTNGNLLAIVKLADILAHDFLFDIPSSHENQERKLLKQFLQLEDKDLEDVEMHLNQEYAERAPLFDGDNGLEQIQVQAAQRARKELSQLALDMDEQNRVMTEMNNVLERANNLALKLSRANSMNELFDAVAKVYQDYNGFRVGIVYTVDLKNRILEGKVWLKNSKESSFLVFLDKEGLPIWDQQTNHFPAGLKKIVSTYKERLPYIGQNRNASSVQICYLNPFYLIPLYSDGEIHGELCLSLEREDIELSRQEELSLIQCGNLIEAHLEKIRQNEKKENYAEELSQALWKSQQDQLQLLQTERLAAVGQLAAGAAHEINNPLAIINSRAEMLQMKENDQKKQKELRQITEQIERISKVLTDLMDFARPAQPELSLINVTEILDRVLEFMAPNLRKSEIEVSKDYHPELPKIYADPSQLEQVFINLCINCQHALEDQKGEIKIRALPEKNENWIRVEIADNGQGIPAKQLRNIFDPFFTTKEEGKGTGLGLSTSRGIIEKHYGELEIQSEEGNGTRARITLPVNLESLRPSIDVDAMANPDKLDKKTSILVVDDEAHIREIMTELLEAEGYTVQTVQNGEEALDQLTQKHYDLMLLDMRMPLRNGLQVLQTIKETNNGIPVIVVTGLASKEEMRKAESMGASKCLCKPFHAKGLLKEIKSVLKAERN